MRWCERIREDKTVDTFPAINLWDMGWESETYKALVLSTQLSGLLGPAPGPRVGGVLKCVASLNISHIAMIGQDLAYTELRTSMNARPSAKVSKDVIRREGRNELIHATRAACS